MPYHPDEIKAQISSLLDKCCELHNCDTCIWKILDTVRYEIIDMLERHLVETGHKVPDVLEYLHEKKLPDKFTKFWWDIAKNKLGPIIDAIHSREWSEETPKKHLT